LEIILSKITEEIFRRPSSKKKVVLYGDFNVINYLYKTELAIDSCIIIYPDSTAVYFAMKYLKKISLKKIVSTDLQERILRNALFQKCKVFFLGDSEEVLSCIKQSLHPYSISYSFHSGYNIRTERVVSQINKIKPDILFVGLGIGIQEKWINDNHDKLNVPFIIAVGGWFKYLAGINKRAPLCMRQMHLEWLHKLIFEFPRVWKRYIIGGPLFIYRVCTDKITIKYLDEDTVV
jgi:N-acetylglucosaminyldiphosphoundecaprenol N-acetyl-beta-D-mannosaminyltransferase